MPTDHHMWRQWLDLPGLRASMGERLTYLNFPDPFWKELPEDRRAEALADWLRWHAVQNVGHEEAAFINMPSQPYRHDDPDKYRLPLENDVIPVPADASLTEAPPPGLLPSSSPRGTARAGRRATGSATARGF